MLYFKDKNGERTWHVGSPFPKPEGRVVEIQADGHELEFLFGAIRAFEEAQADFTDEFDDEPTKVR